MNEGEVADWPVRENGQRHGARSWAAIAAALEASGECRRYGPYSVSSLGSILRCAKRVGLEATSCTEPDRYKGYVYARWPVTPAVEPSAGLS